MRVAYTGRASNVVRYHCYSEAASVGQERCIGFGGMRVDAAVCDELVRVLQPLGIEAALQAIDEDAQADSDALRQVELALERARYEAERAARQYDSVDPENRQVAGELERRWNERLTTVRDLETRLTVQRAAIDHRGMTEAERVSCLSLGADLQQAWQHDNVSAQTRKRILRVAIEEIVACVEGRQILLRVCWRGGDHTELTVYKNRIGEHHHTTDAETGAILKHVARQMPDKLVAALLNRLGRKTGTDRSWTESSVRSYRHHHKIPVYRDGEWAERGELTLNEAATQLQVSELRVRRMIKNKELPARQVCKGAPWVILQQDLNGFDRSRPGDSRQISLFDPEGSSIETVDSPDEKIIRV